MVLSMLNRQLDEDKNPSLEPIDRVVRNKLIEIHEELRILRWLALFLTGAIATYLFTGCVPAPMDEWRGEVQLSCYAAVDRLERGCSQPARVDCAADMAEADGAGCLGPYERVLACWSREDVAVYCAPWGPDVGSQCDQAEWELRTCLWPEVAS